MSLLHCKHGWNPSLLPVLCYVRGLSRAEAACEACNRLLPALRLAAVGLTVPPCPRGAASEGQRQDADVGHSSAESCPRGRDKGRELQLRPHAGWLQLCRRRYSLVWSNGCWQYALLPTASAPAPQSCIPCFWLTSLHLLVCSGLDSKFPSLFYRRHSPCQLLTSGPAPRLSAPY